MQGIPSILTEILSYVIYVALGLIALWGAYCVIVVWRRVAEARFKSEQEQDAFLDTVDRHLAQNDFTSVETLCREDGRAMSQLVLLALVNRSLGYRKLRSVVADRFSRDVLADLEYRLSWVNAVIRSAPMVGLLGTVVGMMGAFAKLASRENVDATNLADNISLALITTACGLAIAIPLVLCTANINVKIRKLEDLVGLGLTRFFETLKVTLSQSDGAPVPRREEARA